MFCKRQQAKNQTLLLINSIKLESNEMNYSIAFCHKKQIVFCYRKCKLLDIDSAKLITLYGRFKTLHLITVNGNHCNIASK